MDADRIRLDATGKTNIIAATAAARGDLRALTQDQIDRTKAKMQAIVAKSLPGTKAQIVFDKGGYPPMAPTEGNRALLTRLNRVNADMGLEPMGELDPMDRGAGDISFVANGHRRPCRPRPGGRGQPCAGRKRRHPVDLPPGQTRRDPDEPAGEGAAMSAPRG